MELFNLYYPLSLVDADKRNYQVITISVDDTPVAAVCYLDYESNKTHIVGIVVAPNYRKQKLGSQLITKLKETYIVITANILLSEITVINFWTSNTFKPVEVNSNDGYLCYRWSKDG